MFIALLFLLLLSSFVLTEITAGLWCWNHSPPYRVRAILLLLTSPLQLLWVIFAGTTWEFTPLVPGFHLLGDPEDQMIQWFLFLLFLIALPSFLCFILAVPIYLNPPATCQEDTRGSS